MKAESEKFLRAYLRVYGEFKRLYAEELLEKRWDEDYYSEQECVKLFEIALRDSLLGDIIMREILEMEMEMAEKRAEEVPA